MAKKTKVESQNQKDEVAQLVSDRYKLSEEYTRPYFDRFLDNYKHYFLRLIDEAVEADPDAYPFYSQLSIPVSYQIVETILPRMFARMFNFSITTEEENDEKDEKALENLIRFQINHPYLIDDPVFVRLVTFLKEAFITGNAWGIVPWYLRDAKVEEWQPISNVMGLTTPSWDNMQAIQNYGLKPEWQIVKTTKRVIDAPVFEHKSIFHVFPDPKKKRVSDLRWLIIEDFLTKEEIQNIIKVAPAAYKNLDQLEELQAIAPNSSRSGMNYDDELAAIFGGSDYSAKDETEGQGQYKVWFMHEPDRYVIVINEKLTIRDGANPNGDGKIGAFLMKDIPVPNELYAWGEPDPIKKIEDSMSDQANMRNDSVFYDLLKMWKLDPTTLIDGEEFVPEPGTVVQMSDLTGLQALDTGSTKPSAYREYQEWEQIIQQISGVTDYATGNVDKSMNKTLGGIELLQQAANARFALKLQLFENLALKAMGTMYVQRNLRFFDTPQTVPTEDGKVQITPDQIRRLRGNIHFIVDSGSSEAVNQATEQTKWTAIINAIGKPPFDQLGREALDEIGTQFLYAMKIPNPETIMGQAKKAAGAPQGTAGGFTQQQLQIIVALIQKAAQATVGVAAQKAKESVSINYKDAPDVIKRQMEKAAGFTPADEASTVTDATGGGAGGATVTPTPTPTPEATTPALTTQPAPVATTPTVQPPTQAQ